ncbi:hydrogenase maturation nickel metallochaperone HypA [Thermoactinomyces sp. AMNI-1]|uniref:Hydrogenase maturation factor HypA n=2 Tax=Thermoactinomyces mirandus TaxID=2756294 RepID=A0A7W1XRQ9_9BACL|nr:hydrogenase maturation nickel metallochaperone HypA [Thermoactinomyces mirandus]
MHEMALMGDILQLVERDAKARNIKQINKIELVVGELSNALPDALEMAFETFRARELAMLTRQSQLVIRKEEARAKCTVCGYEYHPEVRLSICPECGLPSGKLTAGETFKVKLYEGN